MLKFKKLNPTKLLDFSVACLIVYDKKCAIGMLRFLVKGQFEAKITAVLVGSGRPSLEFVEGRILCTRVSDYLLMLMVFHFLKYQLVELSCCFSSHKATNEVAYLKLKVL